MELNLRLILICLILQLQLFGDNASYNRGETLYFSKACSSCHGPGAEGSSTYPRLAHRKSKFIIKKLTDFRAGKAYTISQEMMSQFARVLSNKNIADLAYFFSHHIDVKMDDVDDDILGGFGS